MKRLIVVDETVSFEKDLPGVLVVPFNVYNLPPLSLHKVYEYLEKSDKKNLPTTGAISAKKLYKMIKEKNPKKKEVLFIALPRELSKITEVFEEVAETLKKESVNAEVFDCGQAFASLCFFVEEALKGKENLDKTINRLKRKKEDIFLFGVANLNYLRRSGRVKGVKSFGTKILDGLGFLPIFLIRNGRIKNVKICKKGSIAKTLLELLFERIGYKETFRVNLCYGKESEVVREIKEKLKEISASYIESRMSKAVAVNAGPQTIGFAFERKGYDFIDGEILIKVLHRFYEKIRKEKGLLNLLNLFPVIDSDTGNNLEKTLRPLRELKEKRIKKLLRDINELTAENASGYSGTCMNAFFYGMFKGYKKENASERVKKELLTSMFKKATEYAYLSFKKVKPVEGTILTVIRKTYEVFANSPEEKIERVFIDAYKKCVEEIINPKVRPEILRRKNVVDSGALGFLFLLEAFAEILGRGKEIEEARKKLKNTIKRQRMHFYYKPKEARTKGFCLEFKVSSKELPRVIERLHVNEFSISQRKGYSLIHLHVLPEERERIINLMKNYTLLNETPLSQPWYFLLKNQALMVGEKIKLIPSFFAWSFYWLGLRMIWPFREIKLAREYRKYRTIVKGLEKLIDRDFAIIIKDRFYGRGFEKDELIKIKNNVDGSEIEDYILRIGKQSYKIESIKEDEKIIGRIVTREY